MYFYKAVFYITSLLADVYETEKEECQEGIICEKSIKDEADQENWWETGERIGMF